MSERNPVYYDEAQVNRWLAWLAHTMQRHDQTVFLIENLQPSWLQTRGEVRTFSVVTRMMWGVWASLIEGLIIGLVYGLVYWLFYEQIVFTSYDLLIERSAVVAIGLTVGLIAGLIDAHKLSTDTAKNGAGVAPNTGKFVISFLRGALIFGLITALIGTPYFVLIDGPEDGLNTALIFGLYFGAYFGLVYTSRSTFRTAFTEIRTVEKIVWSRYAALESGRKGLIGGVIVGLIGGLISVLSIVLFVVLSGELYSDLSDALRVVLTVCLFGGLIGGVIGGLIGGLIGGFTPVMEELKTKPNQGIRLSLRSALRVGGIVGLIAGLLIGLEIGIVSVFHGTGLAESIGTGITYGVIVAIALGGWFGGVDVAEHAILRLILARNDYAPLNYARFLDYAANELNFLQKVGGGYIFIHRYLLEYFAGMHETHAPAD